MASNVEEYILRLKQQVSGPAAEATSAMAQLEAQIAKERAALGGLEEKLVSANAKLQALGSAGDNSKKSIAAIERQQQAVAELQAQLAQQSAGVDALEGARGIAEQADAMRAAAAAAQEKAAADAAAASAAEMAAAAAANLAAEEAAAAAAADAEFTALQNAYEAAEAQRQLADQARAAAGALKDQARAAGEASKAAAASQADLPTGKVNELSEAFGRLGGPVGRVGQQVFGVADGLKKMGSAAGMGFTIAAVAAVAAIAAVVALGAGIISLTKKLIVMADEGDQLGKLQKKLQDNLKATFGGAIKIDGFLAKLGTLVNLFDKNTASGKALQFITKTLFQPIIDAATKAIPIIERVFIVAMIWALRAYIAVVKFSRSEIGQGLITGLKIVAAVLGVIVAIVAVAGALLVLPFVLMAAAVLAVAAAIGWVINAVSGPLSAAWASVSAAGAAAWEAVKGAVSSALAWLSGVTLADIGTRIMQSLAQGIASAAGAVVSAVTGAVTGAITAAKSALGIASPSKPFFAFGRNVDESMASGTEGGATEEAFETMVAPPSPTKVKATAKAARAGGGIRVAYFEIHAGAENIATQIRELMRGEFEVEALAGDIEAEGAGA